MRLKHGLFPEIQGLRAIAVGLVLIFHLWPTVLSGGYVGVDVFFVISGYLITGLLVRRAERDGQISLVDFYARRARRLLPAATTVLVAVFCGIFIFLPEVRWEETAIQIAASALYIQNWMLAWLSVDYLGAENAASPVQHYWSLSIEEQFYFIWPLMMIGALQFSKRYGFSLRNTFIVALSIIFAASLAASVILVAREPSWSYFVSHTRIWELALGGLLALVIHRLQFREGGIRVALLAAGLATIAWSAIAYSQNTPFPGWAALAPTLGAACIIVAGDVKFGMFRGLNNRFMIYIGDRSYSIYLWHWPIISFYLAHNKEINFLDGIFIIIFTLVISHISYEYIEDRYRNAPVGERWRPIVCGIASVLSCVAVAAGVQYWMSAQPIRKIDIANDSYPGPAALFTSVSVPDSVEAIPSLASLKRDLPVVYKEKCHQDQRGDEPINCILGNPNGSKTIVVVGDSHAAQWVPAFQRLTERNGWKLVTFTKSACPFSRVEVKAAGGIPYPSCAKWRENALTKIKELRPDFVFTSQSRGYGYVGREVMAQGLRSVWKALTGMNIPVIVIQDTPWITFDPGDCLSAGKPENCSADRKFVEADDLLSYAAHTLRGVDFVDMTDGICGPLKCDAVVGNIIVWRDRNHLTATYAGSLAPYLAQISRLPFN